MVLGGLDDRDAIILDAIDNLLLHVVSDAMFFHMLACMLVRLIIQGLCATFGVRTNSN